MIYLRKDESKPIKHTTKSNENHEVYFFTCKAENKWEKKAIQKDFQKN